MSKRLAEVKLRLDALGEKRRCAMTYTSSDCLSNHLLFRGLKAQPREQLPDIQDKCYLQPVTLVLHEEQHVPQAVQEL